MTEKLCPVCHRKNNVDAVFCIFCGVSLESSLGNHSTTRPVKIYSTAFLVTMEEAYIKSLEVPAKGIALYLMDDTKPIAIREEQEFILGRKLSDIKDEKIVDLTPFGGFEYGISHRHATIRRAGDWYEILDLDSTNGTIVNKKRLLPNKPYPLPGSAKLRLGKLFLYAIYRKTDSKA